MGGVRGLRSWRYRTVKHWLHRVRDYKLSALTPDEMLAWEKVETWMLTLIKNDRVLMPNGSIGMKGHKVD